MGLAEIPAGTKDPRAQNYIVDHVAPGASFSRRFQICNGTSSPISVKLYAGAAVIHDGTFSVVEGRADNELSAWIKISPATVLLEPGQRVLATAHFRVPVGVTAGERYAALLAELPPHRGTTGLAVVDRVGVRVYLDVSTGGAPKSDFTIDSLQAVRRADGTPAVLATVHNTGARALDMRGTLQLSNGPGGLSAGPFPAQVGTTLAPGDSAPVVVPLDKAIRGGPWHAVVDMKSGLLERKASGDVTFPDQADAVSPAVKAKALPLYKDRGLVGTFAGVLIGLLLLALLLWWLLARRRRREDDEVASST